MNKAHFLLLVAIIPYHSAHADWGHGGAAYKCSPKDNLFAIEATTTSSGNQIPPSSGFTELQEEQNPIACVLQGVPIETTILIGDPQPSGMCGAIGQAAVSQFKIENVVVLPIGQLGSPCKDLRGIVRIEVRIHNHNANIKQCSGVWDGGAAYLDVKCETTTLANVGSTSR